MAKDGTGRGGVRIGAGRKPKTMADKILDGKISAPSIKEKSNFKIPTAKSYLDAEQKGGGKTCAKQVYRNTYNWLNSCGCADLVAPQTVENFAQTIARHIQAESAITSTGFLARHPTTGEPMASPYVKISLDYLKAAQQIWYQISQIVKNNSVANYDDDDMMENLLTFRKRA